jgi:hypothetical protein
MQTLINTLLKILKWRVRQSRGGKGFLTNVLLHTESLLLVLEDAFIT